MSIGKSSISRLSGGKQNPAEKTAKKLPEANEVTKAAAKQPGKPAQRGAWSSAPMSLKQ